MVFLSCSVNQSLQYDYTYLYDNGQKLIKPSFKIFHTSADSSTLYFEIKSNDVLYGKLGRDTSLTARILCKYILYDKDGTSILDSATVPFYNHNKNAANQLLQSKLKIAVKTGKKLPLEVRFRDEYRDLNVVNYLWLDKRKNGNAQYYLLKNNRQVLFKQRLNHQDSVQLYKSKLLPAGVYELRYSNSEFEIPPPPFFDVENSKETILFDSLKKIIFIDDSAQLENWTKVNEITPPDDQLKRFYFYEFYSGFPKITNFQKMIPPLRYISTSTEYKRLKESTDPKKAVDNFWIKLADSEAKAKKMIVEYYNRIELTNKEFSSHKAGWKSDRGIIYIVYGKPTKIYKSLNYEKWVYGDENNLLAVSFEFKRIESRFGNFNFRLSRNSDYKSNWYQMVDSWRKGKIY